MNELVNVNQNHVSLYPQESEWNIMLSQATQLVKSGFLPSSIRKPEQAIAIMLKGRELNIPAMQSFSHIHIVQGKPSISAELMLALIYGRMPDAMINFVKIDDTICIIHAKRNNQKEFTKISFSIEDAQKAGLIKNSSSWSKYPRAMLRSRAVSEMARTLFPDIIMGCSYTPEELGADVEIDSAGQEVIINNVEPEKVEKPINRLYRGLYSSDGTKITQSEQDDLSAKMDVLGYDKAKKNETLKRVENYEVLLNQLNFELENQLKNDANAGSNNDN